MKREAFAYFGLLAPQKRQARPDRNPMTDNITTSLDPATRDDLEARYLRALMQRDAVIWAARTEARDAIVSNSMVKRTDNNQPAPRPSLTIFDDPYQVNL